MTTRKNIPDKIRLQVLKRDNFTCKSCGKSPAFHPELQIDVIKLEIDHFNPHSKGGSNNLDNLQTLCIQCNRGKGNDENLNITIKNKIDILLDYINPEINKLLRTTNNVKVVANEVDYSELSRLCGLTNFYKINFIPNTIMGYRAGYNLGIYTINDNGGSKINFILEKI